MLDGGGDDDSDTPPNQPLIRQAVAFPWTPSITAVPATTTINMYQASPLPAPNKFLPGQEVPTPPAPPKPRRTKKKTTQPHSSQTGRFRITSYNPTPATEPQPALTSGDGPYASIYRANAKTPKDSTRKPPEGTPSGSKKRPKPSDSRPKASASKAKVTAVNSKSSAASKGKTPDPQSTSTGIPWPAEMLQTHAPTQPEAGPSSKSHYKRDYDQDATAGASHSVAASSPSPRPEPRYLQVKRPPVYLRLVTILIEDKRGDVLDNQLAEVRVALRDSDNVEQDGYWANARDIVRLIWVNLQAVEIFYSAKLSKPALQGLMGRPKSTLGEVNIDRLS
ncbi:hypothetical protein B0H14DRAFT_2669184 [Mycena olivaceomarginata]|nr:hypothetical protein B0H14DRAFT_2669184 [Mycena olivaceomarginata]